MKIFSLLYNKALEWAEHRHAPRYLGILSFAESSFFPIPPDVMLAPMVLARRHRAWYYAALTTITSVLGGVAGYFIGMFLFEELGQPMVVLYGAQESFAQVKSSSIVMGFGWCLWLGFLRYPTSCLPSLQV